MNFASYPASTPGKNLDVVDVTDTTITIRHPDDGRTKTIPRPADYDPVKGRVAVVAPANRKPERVLESTWCTSICEGVWTVKRYADGSRTATLTERWDTPLSLEELVTEGQRAAQGEYEASIESRDDLDVAP
jgi:hypothetical protein